MRRIHRATALVVGLVLVAVTGLRGADAAPTWWVRPSAGSTSAPGTSSVIAGKPFTLIAATTGCGTAPATLWWADPLTRRWRPALTAVPTSGCRLELPLPSGLRVSAHRFAVTTTGKPPASSNQVSTITANPVSLTLSAPASTTPTGTPALVVDAGPEASGLSVQVSAKAGNGEQVIATGVLDDEGRFQTPYRHRLGRSGRDWVVARIGPAQQRTAWRSIDRVARFDPVVRPTTAADVAKTYRAGCPIGPSGLATIEMNHWGYDGQIHRGVMVVRKDLASRVVTAFGQAFDARWPIRQMVNPNAWNGDDNAMMAANNTSSFNCRRVTGNPYAQSPHTYGKAIDVNTVENPYLTPNGTWLPSAKYGTWRPASTVGLLTDSSSLTVALRKQGFEWFHGWDWQHFEA